MSYKPYDPVESKDNYKPAPSLSALKRKSAALKRALAKEVKIAQLQSLNNTLASELSDRKFENRSK